MEAELSRLPYIGPGASRPDHPFRRHATDVQAITSHEMPLDQRDLGPQTRCDHGSNQPGRAGADHDDVVAAHRLGIDPIRRMDIGHERLIVLVVRQDEMLSVQIHRTDPLWRKAAYGIM